VDGKSLTGWVRARASTGRTVRAARQGAAPVLRARDAGGGAGAQGGLLEV